MFDEPTVPAAPRIPRPAPPRERRPTGRKPPG